MREDLIDRIIKQSESSDSPLLKLLIAQINETKRLAELNGGSAQGRPFPKRLANFAKHKREEKTNSAIGMAPSI